MIKLHKLEIFKILEWQTRNFWHLYPLLKVCFSRLLHYSLLRSQEHQLRIILTQQTKSDSCVVVQIKRRNSKQARFTAALGLFSNTKAVCFFLTLLCKANCLHHLHISTYDSNITFFYQTLGKKVINTVYHTHTKQALLKIGTFLALRAAFTVYFSKGVPYHLKQCSVCTWGNTKAESCFSLCTFKQWKLRVCHRLCVGLLNSLSVHF